MFDALSQFTVAELITLFVSGFFGVIWHYISKIVEQRKTDKQLTIKGYFVGHTPETLASFMGVVAAVWGLIEFDQASIFTALIVGYTIDSQINKFRNRSENLLK